MASPDPAPARADLVALACLAMALGGPELAAWAQEAPGGEAGKPPEVDWVEVAMGFTAGLVLFLYGVGRMSAALKEVAGERLKRALGLATKNRFLGLLTGAGTTVALDSSSATIILLIALVDSGLMSFAQGLPVILGSNIGTTFSSQLFAFNVDDYAPVALLAGFLLHAFARGERWRHVGDALLGFGLVFFGLHTIGAAAEPLAQQPRIAEWLKTLESPLTGVLAGAALTVAIQSSSATLGIVIALASQGLVTLPAGLAIMLGAEIGTCADTLVATAGRSRAAVRAGVFHLAFNVATVTAGVLLIHQLAWFATATAGDDVGRQIANAHLAFNIAGALAVLAFVGLIARLLERLIPDAAGGPAGDPADGRKEAVPAAGT